MFHTWRTLAVVYPGARPDGNAQYGLLRRGDGQAGTKGYPYAWNWSRRNTIWTLSCSRDKGKKGPVLRAALSGGSSSQGRKCAYLQLPVGRVAGGYRAAPLVAQGRLRQARGRVAARNTTPPSTGVYGARELQGSGSWRRWFARFRRGLRV